MKQQIIIALLLVSYLVAPVLSVHAQDPVTEAIKAGVKKVIKAIDLKIQRLQNNTIWLQNAQKTLENKMSKLKLDEISDWVEKQRKLYADYFDELWQVKAALTYYHRVKEIIEGQVSMVGEYKAAWALFRQDKNFTADELDYMSGIYTGLFNESVKSIDQLFLVVNAFATQMSDAKRLEIINSVSDNLEQQHMDLKEFNEQHKMISLQRAGERGEIETVKRLYGL
jgi:hypothetical protein